MKNFYVLTLFWCFSMQAQLHSDSITMEYFYKDELKNLVQLKKNFNKNPSNLDLQLKIANFYEDLNIEDSAFYHYYALYDKLKHIPTDKEKLLEVILKAHLTVSSKNAYEKDRRSFLNELFETSKSSPNQKKWLSIYHFELAKDYFIDSLNYPVAMTYYLNAKNSEHYKSNLDFKQSILLNVGHLNTALKKFEASKKTLNEGLNIAKQLQDQTTMVMFFINLGVNEKKQSNYEAALNYFLKASQVKFEKNKPKMYRFIYNNLADCYDYLGKKDELAETENIIEKLNVIINDFQKNSHFYEIDAKYQLKEKEAEILTLSQKFKKNKILYLSLISITFLLALYSFIRWKKEDQRKKIIAEEKSQLEVQHYQTVEELEKTKQLVIEDHIVLKNKAKIYLEELIYIKAEDHYLQLITTGKKEFVRGKLSEMIKQLPPNFVKCHRSYIINRNFVKQFLSNEVEMKNDESLPVSRGFKI